MIQHLFGPPFMTAGLVARLLKSLQRTKRAAPAGWSWHIMATSQRSTVDVPWICHVWFPERVYQRVWDSVRKARNHSVISHRFPGVIWKIIRVEMERTTSMLNISEPLSKYCPSVLQAATNFPGLSRFVAPLIGPGNSVVCGFSIKLHPQFLK